MGIIINTEEAQELNFAPETVEEEVAQNLWLLYSSMEYDCPMDRGLGIDGDCIDRPIETAKALITAEIYDKTEEYEPRAEIVDISFSEDYGQGIIKPIVEVEINGEYDEEDTE